MLPGAELSVGVAALFGTDRQPHTQTRAAIGISALAIPASDFVCISIRLWTI